MGLLHPKEGDIKQLPRTTYKEIDEIVTEAGLKGDGGDGSIVTDGGTRSVADRLNDSRIIGLAIAVFPAYFILDAWILQPGGISNLTLNSINALFLLLAILLWVRPTAIVAQMKDSVSNISGIIFQFPFYDATTWWTSGMSRWLFVGAALVGLLLLGSLAGSSALHSTGETDCPTIEDSAADEPTHGTHESDMYAEEDGGYADCPVDDGVAMGGSTTRG